MAVRFHRLLTALTIPKASCYLRRMRQKKLSYSRARSASLPDHLQPVVAGLHDSTNALLSWTEAPAQAGPAWISEGVGHLGWLLAGLTDLLHHPQVQDQLQRRRKTAPWTKQLLHDLLLLADANWCFREVILALKHLLTEEHAALRRRNATRLAIALHSRRRLDRDISHLASTLRDLFHRSSSPVATSDSDEAALAAAVAAATCATAAASTTIFAGLAFASSASRTLTSPTAASPTKVAAAPVWWVDNLQRWRRCMVSVASRELGPRAKETSFEECCDEEEERKAARERLWRLEECVMAAEDGCEQVYRALVNTRVSLLNVLTSCF